MKPSLQDTLAASKAPSIIGLDIGGSKLACVEGTADGGILARQEAPTLASEPFERRFPVVIAMVNSQMAAACAAGRRITALSVSIGGPARQVVADEALPQAAAACEIMPCVLGSKIGDVASLMAALTDRVCGPLGRR